MSKLRAILQRPIRQRFEDERRLLRLAWIGGLIAGDARKVSEAVMVELGEELTACASSENQSSFR